ncbi:hypothetical protein IGI53_001670 [Enterococcus sp. DIV0788_1]
MWNFFYQASYQLLVVMLPVITVPIVSRALQPEGIGTWNYVNSIVSYFILVAGLGLASYGVREIAFVHEDKKKLSKKFWEIQGFNALFSSLVFIIYLIYAFLSPYRTLFLLQAITVFATLLDISWFFQGIEDFKKISLINTIVKIMTLILTILLVRDKNDLNAYVGILSVSSLASGVAFWFFIKEKIIWVKVSIKDMGSHFRPALSFFIVKAASTLFNNLNKTILGFMTTMSIVGIFSNALVMIMLITAIVNSLNTVLLPRMSSLQKENQEDQMIDLLGKAIDIQVFMASGCMFITLGIISGVVELFLGKSFIDVIYIVPILLPVMLLSTIQQAIANMYLVPKNKMKSYTNTILIATLINIILCFILIPKMGAHGAAISYTVGQLYLALSRVIVLVKDTTYKFNFKNLFLCLLSGVIAYLSIEMVSNFNLGVFMLTFLQGVVGLCVYIIVTFLVRTNPIVSILRSK